jgi:GNAT superfamily N-acetyltransferase
VAYLGAREAGYVEMEIQEGGNIEIVYFGLLPLMIGKGIGGGMLSLAVREAWKIKGTQRVWLHTCSEDHPHALGNYQKRGFRLFKTEVI